MRSPPSQEKTTNYPSPAFKLVLGWLWLGDPGGEDLFLLHFGSRGLRHVSVLGWLWPGDPGGEDLFLLHFGPRGYLCICQLA